MTVYFLATMKMTIIINEMSTIKHKSNTGYCGNECLIKGSTHWKYKVRILESVSYSPGVVGNT